MAATTDHTNIIKSYFTAWEKYDLSTIRSIFSPEAVYEVRPRQRIFYGIEDIASYWMRNQKRQQSLVLSWDIVDRQGDCTRAYFQADFYDKEEQNNQTVTGIIDFTISPHLRTIEKLSETYYKEIL